MAKARAQEARNGARPGSQDPAISMRGTPFPSAWAGERICWRCRVTEKWRDARLRARVVPLFAIPIITLRHARAFPRSLTTRHGSAEGRISLRLKSGAAVVPVWTVKDRTGKFSYPLYRRLTAGGSQIRDAPLRHLPAGGRAILPPALRSRL